MMLASPVLVVPRLLYLEITLVIDPRSFFFCLGITWVIAEVNFRGDCSLTRRWLFLLSFVLGDHSGDRS